MSAPCTRRHVKAALDLGATPQEIMEVLKLCVVQGVQACHLYLSKWDSDQSMHFMCVAFGRRKTRAKLRRARSGECAARNSMPGEGAPVVIPAWFTEDVRADFRARKRLDFRRVVRIGAVMGWPGQSRPLKGSPRDLRGLESCERQVRRREPTEPNTMSSLSIAKSRNPKCAASKKRSVPSRATARRKVTSTAANAKTPSKANAPKIERVTKQERLLTLLSQAEGGPHRREDADNRRAR